MWPIAIWRGKRGRQSKMGSPTTVVDPPRCSSCGKTEAVVYWRRVDDYRDDGAKVGPGESLDVDDDLEERLVCNECSAAAASKNNNNNADSNNGNDDGADGNYSLMSELSNADHLLGFGLRKSRRSTTVTSAKASTNRQRASASVSSSVMSSSQATAKLVTPKGKSRRTIFKKSATKSPAAVATVVTTGSIFHQGIYYQIGDVVSMIDVKGGVYYAQIRGLLQDQYCEKSAVVTWLLPTQNSPDPESGFDPNTYIIGPEEDIPRRLECMDFVCHAPSEYFKAKNSPYPTITQTKPELGFIWTRLKPQIKQINDKRDNLFESGS